MVSYSLSCIVHRLCLASQDTKNNYLLEKDSGFYKWLLFGFVNDILIVYSFGVIDDTEQTA